MTLHEHIIQCQQLANELGLMGIDTREINVLAHHGASGDSYEIMNPTLREVDEELAFVFDYVEGTKYVNFEID
jgi:methyl coenzyme M reductase gamma subunit